MSPQVTLELDNLARNKYSPVVVGVGIVLLVIVVGLAGVFGLCNVTQV